MRFFPHVCNTENGCIKCKEYINNLDKEVAFQNRNSSRVRRSPARMGKRKHQSLQRKFDLPKPLLSQTN